jgi:RimJ/RimL family protein N-acetyltransferase
MKFVLETDRLRLRELTGDDLDFVASVVGDPQVMRYYPQVYSRKEAREWIERQLRRYRDVGYGLWLAADRPTGEPRGLVGLIQQDVDGMPRPEIAYIIHRPFWNRGLAFEAGMEIRRHAFEDRGLPRVISLIRPDNLPSQGVARKLGMHIEGRTMFHGLPHFIFGMGREDAGA